ncbi:Uncharacterised protein [Sphingobacterium spiritivorum]|nr:Uncharacterised protein [Sphingobacterium spiritivorum]
MRALLLQNHLFYMFLLKLKCELIGYFIFYNYLKYNVLRIVFILFSNI